MDQIYLQEEVAKYQFVVIVCCRVCKRIRIHKGRTNARPHGPVFEAARSCVDDRHTQRIEDWFLVLEYYYKLGSHMLESKSGPSSYVTISFGTSINNHLTRSLDSGRQDPFLFNLAENCVRVDGRFYALWQVLAEIKKVNMSAR